MIELYLSKNMIEGSAVHTGVRPQSKVWCAVVAGVRPQSKVARDCTLAPDPRAAPDLGAAGAEVPAPLRPANVFVYLKI